MTITVSNQGFLLIYIVLHVYVVIRSVTVVIYTLQLWL